VLIVAQSTPEFEGRHINSDRKWSWVMSGKAFRTRARLKTPKAAAIAGIAFSVLLIAILWLLRRSVPADPLDTGAWIATDSDGVVAALNLVPFAGIAFLWFIGVLRDRLGEQEDRFFASVFFGSSLLFLAMLFAAAAIAGAVMLLAANASEPDQSDQLTHLSFCARYRLYHRECLRDQNGMRVHDLNVHRRDPHRDSPALDRHSRFFPGMHPTGWQLLLELEYRCFSGLGPPAEYSHPDL
jgi:hypothetical protein